MNKSKILIFSIAIIIFKVLLDPHSYYILTGSGLGKFYIEGIKINMGLIGLIIVYVFLQLVSIISIIIFDSIFRRKFFFITFFIVVQLIVYTSLCLWGEYGTFESGLIKIMYNTFVCNPFNYLWTGVLLFIGSGNYLYLIIYYMVLKYITLPKTKSTVSTNDNLE